jgi:hypothetical protein
MEFRLQSKHPHKLAELEDFPLKAGRVVRAITFILSREHSELGDRYLSIVSDGMLILVVLFALKFIQSLM